MNLLFLGACGFTPNAEYNAQRIAYKGNCNGLTLTDRFAYNNENEGSTRQTYKVQTDKNAKGYDYKLHHSYLNDNNFMGRITVEKNIKSKICKDHYLRDARILDQ